MINKSLDAQITENIKRKITNLFKNAARFF